MHRAIEGASHRAAFGKPCTNDLEVSHRFGFSIFILASEMSEVVCHENLPVVVAVQGLAVEMEL